MRYIFVLMLVMMAMTFNATHASAENRWTEEYVAWDNGGNFDKAVAKYATDGVTRMSVTCGTKYEDGSNNYPTMLLTVKDGEFKQYSPSWTPVNYKINGKSGDDRFIVGGKTTVRKWFYPDNDNMFTMKKLKGKRKVSFEYTMKNGDVKSSEFNIENLLMNHKRICKDMTRKKIKNVDVSKFRFTSADYRGKSGKAVSTYKYGDWEYRKVVEQRSVRHYIGTISKKGNKAMLGYKCHTEFYVIPNTDKFTNYPDDIVWAGEMASGLIDVKTKDGTVRLPIDFYEYGGKGVISILSDKDNLFDVLSKNTKVSLGYDRFSEFSLNGFKEVLSKCPAK